MVLFCKNAVIKGSRCSIEQTSETENLQTLNQMSSSIQDTSTSHPLGTEFMLTVLFAVKKYLKAFI